MKGHPVIDGQDCDLHAYTSGRWLRNDKEQCDARRVEFDLGALCRRVLDLCPGASSITSVEKKEGGFNKVLFLTTDSRQRVVARFPTSASGPDRLTTNSEVAVIRYLQTWTKLPIPEVLDWNDNPQNPIGHEYVIMEHCQGIQLSEIWASLSSSAQIRCIESLARCLQQMAALEFPAYGSLYFSGASAISGLPVHWLNEDFAVGPHCGTKYWDCNVDDTRYCHFRQPNRGPWLDLEAFSQGLIDTGLTRIPPNDIDRYKTTPFQGHVEDHTNLLAASKLLLWRLINDEKIRKAGAPTLIHPDFHLRNIFVDEQDTSKITGIIDWQSTSIEPAFMYADMIPDFALPNTQSSTTEILHGKAVLTKSEICAAAFDACLRGLVPRLESARDLDEGLLRLFRYSHRTWKDGITALQEELITLSRRWKELDLDGQCTYDPPTGATLEEHRRQYNLFNTSLKLKKDLIDILETDSAGWVPNEAFEATKESEAAIFAQLSNTVAQERNADMTVEDLRLMWPFDLALHDRGAK